jgi:hypothetical protein
VLACRLVVQNEPQRSRRRRAARRPRPSVVFVAASARMFLHACAFLFRQPSGAVTGQPPPALGLDRSDDKVRRAAFRLALF